MNKNNNNIPKKRYPKSKRGLQCIGPCYNPRTVVVHPHTLQFVTDDKAFCPIAPNEYTDAFGNKQVYITDRCLAPMSDKDVGEKEIEMNTLIPEMDFNCAQFLKIYYEIGSLEDVFEWIDINKKSSIFTRLRIFTCGINGHLNQLEMIDDRVVDFFIDLTKKIWIKDIYPIVAPYLYVDRETNTIYIKDYYSDDYTRNSEESINSYKVEKINFFIEKFVSRNRMMAVLNKYFFNKNNNTVKIKYFDDDDVKNEYIGYIMDKIYKVINVQTE